MPLPDASHPPPPPPPPPTAVTLVLFLSSNFCSREEVAEVYNTPMLELVYNAATVHRMYNDPSMVRGGQGCEVPS